MGTRGIIPTFKSYEYLCCLFPYFFHCQHLPTLASMDRIMSYICSQANNGLCDNIILISYFSIGHNIVYNGRLKLMLDSMYLCVKALLMNESKDMEIIKTNVLFFWISTQKHQSCSIKVKRVLLVFKHKGTEYTKLRELYLF